MNLADLLKKNIVMVPVVASVLVGTFTGVKYIVNLTDTINGNRAEIEKNSNSRSCKSTKRYGCISEKNKYNPTKTRTSRRHMGNG
jgi:transposase